MLHGDLDGVADGIPDRPLGGTPEQVDPGDVNDALERQPPRRCPHGTPQGDETVATQFPNGAVPPAA